LNTSYDEVTACRRTDGTADSRMNHLGCPVLYGDKWIGNKWIRSSEQVA
jgi:hypothetical protein